MSAIDQFREALKAVSRALEDAAITDGVYWEIIDDAGIISRDDLQQRVEEALQDPKRRAEFHEVYSQMWKVLEETGNAAFFEDLLKDLPPTDKPN